MASAQRTIVEDVEHSETFVSAPGLAVMLHAGARAVQSTPLVSSSGKILGIVSTHFAEPHRPDERELQLMDLLARQAADYLQRKQAEESLLRTAQELAHSSRATAWKRTCNRRARRVSSPTSSSR